jgi:hypothetical protein
VRIRGRRVGLALVVGAGLVLAGEASWRGLVVPWVAGQLTAASGHKVTIGSLWPRWRGVEARDVEVAGAPPFAATPLARIERLTIRIGGPGFGSWQPSDIEAAGVRITYLRTGSLDNVQGEAQARRERGRSPSAARPALRLRDGRLEGYVRLPGAPAVIVRARSLTGTSAAGAHGLQAEGFAAEVQGVLTVSAPTLSLTSTGGTRTLAGTGASIVVPGGGVLVSDLEIGGRASAEESVLTLASPADAVSPGGFSASAHLRDGGAHVILAGHALPLRALYPVLSARGLDPTRAHADLDVTLDAEPSGGSPFVVAVAVQDLDLFHPQLDTVPWRGLPFAGRATGKIDLAGSRVDVERGRLELLGVALSLRGFAELAPTLRGRWEIATPADAPSSCARLLGLQAPPVQQALAGLELDGNLGLSLAVTFEASNWEGLALDFTAEPLCHVRREPSALVALEARLGGAPAATLDLPLPPHPDFVPIAKMPRHLIAAFLTSEDGRFRDHHGFDLEMIRRALAHDLEVGSFARGASTITQQLAKNLFLTPERTLARKLEEAVFTWRIDERLDKDRVLELYLNVIELGPGIRGVKRAAEVYFGKSLRELGPLESAHLAALTPNPLGYARRFRDGRVDDGWLHRLYDLLGMMKRSGRLSAAELAAARGTRLSLRKI